MSGSDTTPSWFASPGPVVPGSASSEFTLFAGALQADSVSREATLERGPQFCTPDVNANGAVDFADITLILINYGRTYPFSGPGDADLSGVVNFLDITFVLSAGGAVCM